MLLARAAARRGEVAIRLTLGSSRWRLGRQLLTESVILSTLGGVAGLVIAYWCTVLILALKPPIPIPIALDLTFNPRVLMFALAASFTTGVWFGLAPALQSSRAELVPSLKPDGATSLGLRRFSLRNGLVVFQGCGIAPSFNRAAVLMLRSVGNAQQVDPGFETEQVVMVSTNLGLHGYNEARRPAILPGRRGAGRSASGYRNCVRRRQAASGCRRATRTIAPEHQQAERIQDWPEIDVATIGPGYFDVMSIPLIQGRDFTAQDTAEAPDVVILNETAARRFWPGESPVGEAGRHRELGASVGSHRRRQRREGAYDW